MTSPQGDDVHDETGPLEALIVDLLAWLARGPRPYDEVMSAWRTSCPRLPVWEEATARGLVERVPCDGSAVVALTEAGRRSRQLWGRRPDGSPFLQQHRRDAVECVALLHAWTCQTESE